MIRSLYTVALLVVLLLTACSTSASPTPTTVPPTPTLQGQAQVTATPAETRVAPSVTETTQPAETGTPTASPSPTAEPTVAAASTPAATATTADTTPAPVETGTAAESEELDEIAEETAQLRELNLKSPVQDAYLTRQQLRDRLVKTLDTEYPPSEAEADERVLKAFGLVPEDTDLRELLLDLYTEQIAGFYEPKTDDMFVISDGKELTALEEVTYAHEVTHALQDQHYDLDKLSSQYEDTNDDASTALSSLFEGDATLLQTEYLERNPQLLLGLSSEILGDPPSSEQLDKAPPIVRESLLFPYEQGQKFVTHLHNSGGWKAVNEAYADLPASTEQILHPEKYTNRDRPTDVDLPDLAATLGAGWKKLEDNNFGEFQTRVMLEGEGEKTEAQEAAEGWDGDRYEFWANGEQEVIAWETAWDSDRDAREFAAALRGYDESRFGGAFADSNGTLTLSADGRVALIREDGDRVSYVLAPTQEIGAKVLAALS